VKRRLIIFSILLTAVPLAAQGVPPGDRVLVPVFMAPAAGAYGSLWRSELWIYNDNAEAAGTGLVPAIPAKETAGPIAGTQPAGSPAAVLNVPPELAPGLHVNLSRQSETWGTEIPVVRESEFFAGRLSLVSVPVNERFRQTVRIDQFVPFGEAPGTVRVRYFRIGDGSDLLLQEDVLGVRKHHQQRDAARHHDRAAVAVLDDRGRPPTASTDPSPPPSPPARLS